LILNINFTFVIYFSRVATFKNFREQLDFENIVSKLRDQIQDVVFELAVLLFGIVRTMCLGIRVLSIVCPAAVGDPLHSTPYRKKREDSLFLFPIARLKRI